MTEPKFRDTVLYKMLKSGGFIGGQIMKGIRGYNTSGRKKYIEGTPDPKHPDDPDFNQNAHRDAVTTGEALIGVMGDLTHLAGTPIRATAQGIRTAVPRATSMAEDAGRRLGHVFGDMFGKINTSKSPYGDDDIVSLLNEKEEIQVLNRETERLRRIARIQARKRKQIKEMTEQALRSPYL